MKIIVRRQIKVGCAVSSLNVRYPNEYTIAVPCSVIVPCRHRCSLHLFFLHVLISVQRQIDDSDR